MPLPPENRPKRCPFCGRIIQMDLRACPYCKSMLTPPRVRPPVRRPKAPPHLRPADLTPPPPHPTRIAPRLYRLPAEPPIPPIRHSKTVVCPKCGTAFPVIPMQKTVLCPGCRSRIPL